MAEDSELLFSYARRGDVQSLSTLVRRHSVWMQALLRGMLGDAADVDDAFQAAWMRIIKSAGGYHGGSARAYLASAARSAAIDLLRRRGRTVSLDADDEAGEATVETVPDMAPSPGERFESKATAEDVRAAVRALPEAQRQVLLMRIEGEMSFREIADELGIPLGTALTWMRKATERIKGILGGER